MIICRKWIQSTIFGLRYEYGFQRMSTERRPNMQYFPSNLSPSSAVAIRLLQGPVYDRHFHGFRQYSTSSDSEPSEVEKLAYKLLYIRIDNQEDRERLAALYMQATEGPNKNPKPGKDSPSEIIYWEGWMQLGEMPKMEAEEKYVMEANRLINENGSEKNNMNKNKPWIYLPRLFKDFLNSLYRPKKN